MNGLVLSLSRPNFSMFKHGVYVSLEEQSLRGDLIALSISLTGACIQVGSASSHRHADRTNRKQEVWVGLWEKFLHRKGH